MSIDIHARSLNVNATPIIILRWIFAFAMIMALMAAEAGLPFDLPEKPLLILIGAGAALNIYTMATNKRRQVSEGVACLHIAFDLIQLSAVLMFTGGIENPFRILLLAPLALAASMLSLYNLCLLLILSIVCMSVMSFGTWPLDWPAAAEGMPTLRLQGTWIALLLAVMLVSFITWRLAAEARRINAALAQTRDILEEKRRISALGTLAAAAVHELGSPLGTIAVVVREMEREIHPDDPLAEDVTLLRDQTEKCKKILADLARNPDKRLEQPVSVRLDRLLMEITTAQDESGSGIKTAVISRVPENLPFMQMTPSLEYGLGNLIGNALSFAKTRVTVTVEGSADAIEITIADDGPGFDAHTLQEAGKPYISTRETREGHLGLGIFIAVNLLQATGASLQFSNGRESGALISINWPRETLEGQEKHD